MFSKDVTNRFSSQGAATKDVPKLKKQLRRVILQNKMINASAMHKSQQSFNKLTQEPGPITYCYDMASIANRSFHEKVSSTARSNEIAPFNARTMRFSQSQANFDKYEAPGPASYYPKGPISSFDRASAATPRMVVTMERTSRQRVELPRMEVEEPGPGYYQMEDPWEKERQLSLRAETMRLQSENQLHRQQNTSVAERLFENAQKPNFVLTSDFNFEVERQGETVVGLNTQKISDGQRRLQHKHSAIFSKFKEKRLHPDLMPGQHKNQTSVQTPGPTAYLSKFHEIANQVCKKSLNQSASFKAISRPKVDARSRKDNFPGPGDYALENSNDQRKRDQGLFSKTLGHGLVCDKEDKAHQSESVTQREIGPGSYFKQDKMKSQKLLLRQYQVKLFKQALLKSPSQEIDTAESFMFKSGVKRDIITDQKQMKRSESSLNVGGRDSELTFNAQSGKPNNNQPKKSNVGGRKVKPPCFPREKSQPIQQLPFGEAPSEPKQVKPQIQKMSTFPFKASSKDRFSYQMQRDPNFSHAKSTSDNKEIKIQGKLPQKAMSNVPNYAHGQVFNQMRKLSQDVLKEESEIMQKNPQSSLRTRSNLQVFSPPKTKFFFVQPANRTLQDSCNTTRKEDDGSMQARASIKNLAAKRGSQLSLFKQPKITVSLERVGKQTQLSSIRGTPNQMVNTGGLKAGLKRDGSSYGFTIPMKSPLEQTNGRHKD